MCMGSFDFFELFAQVFGSMTHEQVIELFEGIGMKPVQVATSLNQDIRDMLEHDPCYDPRGDYLPYIAYLSGHGFVYDSDMKAFREAD